MTPIKKIKDIIRNQDYLFNALEQVKLETNNFLLDGHFCLLNNNGEVVRIPEDTFLRISPTAIIVLTATPKAIYQRLFDRDNQEYNIEFLDSFQNEELKYSKEISAILNIPYNVIKVENNDHMLKNVIAELLR